MSVVGLERRTDYNNDGLPSLYPSGTGFIIYIYLHVLIAGWSGSVDELLVDRLNLVGPSTGES